MKYRMKNDMIFEINNKSICLHTNDVFHVLEIDSLNLRYLVKFNKDLIEWVSDIDIEMIIGYSVPIYL